MLYGLNLKAYVRVSRNARTSIDLLLFLPLFFYLCMDTHKLS